MIAPKGTAGRCLQSWNYPTQHTHGFTDRILIAFDRIDPVHRPLFARVQNFAPRGPSVATSTMQFRICNTSRRLSRFNCIRRDFCVQFKRTQELNFNYLAHTIHFNRGRRLSSP